jgi:hypothetical protein
MTSWGATKAKAQFSAVLDRAESEGPQLIERRKKRFFLVTEEEFAKAHAKAKPGSPHEDFVSGWDMFRPPDSTLFDYDFPRAKGKVRAAKV